MISTPEANYEMIFHSKSFYSSEYHLVTDNGVVKLAIPDDSDVEGIFKKQLIVNLRSDWNTGGTAYPAGSLVSIALPELQHGMLKIKPIFTPAGKSSIYSVAISKGFVLVNILKNVQNKLLSFTLDKSDWKQSLIDTPEFGSLEIMSASGKSNDYFISSNSFLMPTSLYYGHNSQLTKVKSHTEFFETSKFEVSQHEAISKDGTKIPYFLVSRKGIPWNGRQPTLLYAYGGFEVSITPYYSATTGTAWLERGGIYVVANIRGGGEFGPSWHQGALKGKRQVAYDDFYAVAEDLIRKKITSPEHLGIHGGSNGGLLVGVALTQHPELFNAVVCEVPLLDMKRYSKLLAGASWMEEYGNPDIPEDWEYIRKYSPYHNVSAEKKYPEALFITSTKDDRVHPAHARKMVAMMESLGHKVYYYESMEGGHGGASTTEQMAYLDAIMYTYLHMKLSTTANE